MGSKDHRRNIGPDKTIPYIFHQTQDEAKFFSKSKQRFDGRSSLDMQKLFMTLDVISQAKGSSFVEIGNTKIMCAIYGPKEVQKGNDFKSTGQVFCEVRFAPFSGKIRKSPQPEKLEKEMSRQIKEALESVIILDKFPKSQIDVFISVVELGGSVLSTCVTAAGLALCHAGIHVYDIVVGAELIWMKNSCYISPTQHEEDVISAERLKGTSGCGTLALAMMPKFAKGQISLLIQQGELDTETASNGINFAIDACTKIHSLAKRCIMKHLEKSALEAPSSPDPPNV